MTQRMGGVDTTNQRRVLLVDEDPRARLGVHDYLKAQGFEVSEAGTLSAARAAIASIRPDVVVVDYVLPDGEAPTLLTYVRETAPGVPVLLVSGHGTVERAVEAMQSGAESFLTKPVDMRALHAVMLRAIESARAKRRVLAERRTHERHVADPFLGSSDVIRRMADDARQLAELDAPVLILGPTGTGKGILASWLHDHGPRADEPFMDINCASLSSEFLETELFGHARGAFTGAVSDKPGLFEVAHLGSVFLDEIGDMDIAVQPKLLKVIEEQRFRRMGDIQDRVVNVRVIAATHHDVVQLTREKRFREDLYFRINGFSLRVPALNERREDIPVLAQHLTDELSRETGLPHAVIAPDAMRALERYHWPGNLRELRNVLERSLLLGERGVISTRDLRFENSVPPAAVDDGAHYDVRLPLHEVERRHIGRVMADVGGVVEAAARRLSIPRSTLYQKLRLLGLRNRPRSTSQI